MSSTMKTLVRHRHRSVPSDSASNSEPTPTNHTQSSLILTAATSAGPSNNPQRDPKLVAQADSIAKISFELNLRAISKHAERLEQDVRALVVQTGQNQEFQRQNQDRLVEVMAELQAVKTNMTALEGKQQDTNNAYYELRQLMSELNEGFQAELQNLKAGVDEMFIQLDTCVTIDDVKEEVQAELANRTDGSVMDVKFDASPAIKTRVQEAINSTRRWNREHKSTQLPDSQFAVDYLRKQSQRDPKMAVLLQRSLLKRLRLQNAHTPGRAWSQPHSLEELCREVAWQEVIDMVKDVLVVNEQRTIKLLRRASVS